MNRLINLNRITSIQIAKKENDVYVVFQDGRHNYGCKVEKLEDAEAMLNEIKDNGEKWFSVPSELIEMSFKSRKIDEDLYRLPNVLIKDLEGKLFSRRTINALMITGVKHLYELTLIERDELLKFRNLGRLAMSEIDNAMEKFNIQFNCVNSLRDMRNPFKNSYIDITISEIKEKCPALSNKI